MDYENAKSNISTLIKKFKSSSTDWNEAMTRFHLIDELLMNCLGWDKDDIEVEEHTNGGYSDYVLKNPRKILVVEAKREGFYFDYPMEGKDSKNNKIRKISSLISDCPKLKPALEQVSRYCQEGGVQFGCVTNGYQLIIFIANRADGISPLDGKAYFFTSLDDMERNFLEIWNIMSKIGIESNKIILDLTGETLSNIPHKLSERVIPYPGIKNRNELQTDLQILAGLVLFDEVESEEMQEHFFKECYVQDDQLSKYSLASKNILKSRYKKLFEESNVSHPILTKLNKEKDVPEIFDEVYDKSPIILLGDVGVGKTTFIKHFIEVTASNEDEFKDSINIYLDLGKKVILTEHLNQEIVEKIIEVLMEKHELDIFENNFVRGIYHSELSKFKRGIYKDYYENDRKKYKEKELEKLDSLINNEIQHLKSSLLHLIKGRSKQVNIFFDNVDQRRDEDQQQIFLIAQELSKDISANVFVTLRPETFYLSRSTGTLSAYHTKAFTISPPRIDSVIKKRLQLAIKITKGEIASKSFKGAKVDLASLGIVLEVLLNSLKQNKDLVMLLDNLCNGNVRLALDFINTFLGSGHVNTTKMIEILKNDKRFYRVSNHEFLRALIFGETIHYSDPSSHLINPFDLISNDSKEHFLLLELLAFLDKSSKKSSNAGFTKVDDTYSHLQGLGYIVEQIDYAIRRGIKKSLIEQSSRGKDYTDSTTLKSLRVTTSGLYCIKYLCKEFAYLDAIIIDTPILDDEERNKIFDVDIGDILERIDRSNIFLKYLNNAWESLDYNKFSFDWKEISTSLGEELTKIHLKITQERAP